MADKNLFVLGGLGLLAYFLLKSQSAPATYPNIYGQPQTGPLPPTPKPSSGGFSIGGGGGGGGGTSSGGSTTGTPGIVTIDTHDPCDSASSSFNPDLCVANSGSIYTSSTGPVQGPPNPMDTMDPCDPNSSLYNPSICGQAIPTTTYDSGNICDPTSMMYDPNACAGYSGAPSTVDYSTYDTSLGYPTGGGGGSGGDVYSDPLMLV